MRRNDADKVAYLIVILLFIIWLFKQVIRLG